MVTLLNILLLSLAAFTSLRINIKSSDRMFYRTLANSLTYSATEISSHLTNVETMSSLVLSNTSIQENLSVIKDSLDSIARADAYKNLSCLIPEYYQAYKTDNISYINLYNSAFTTYSNVVLSNQVPDDVHQEIVRASEEKDGAPCWVTRYGKDYGVYLGRSIRRIDGLKLDSLGTLVTCIDIDKLIRSCTDFSSQYGNTSYLLFDRDELVYHSHDLPASSASYIQENLSSDYGVLCVGEHDYFSVSGIIPEFGWTYILMLPYDTVTQPLRLSRMVCFAMIIVSILLSILSSNSLLNSIIFHLYTLVTKMQTFARDEPPQFPSSYDYSKRRDEIGILHRQFDYMAGKIRDLIQKNYVNELLKKEAQIKALETQINPHFLYNTLESINWRAKALHEPEISSMVESLGFLLRSSLSRQESSYTLGQELSLIHHYMTIQEIRFKQRLQYTLHIDQGITLDMPFPKLTLQPLIENAITYALESSPEICQIEVSINQDTDFLYLSVKNSNSEFEDNLLEKLENNSVTPHGFGIGLLNIQKRLCLTYGLESALELFNENSMAVARITLPKDIVEKKG